MMLRYLQRNLDGSTLLYEEGRTHLVPASVNEQQLVATMVEFYTPEPALGEGSVQDHE